LRWDDIAGVKLVSWTSEGEESQGVLVGLKEEAKGPLDSSEMLFFSTELKREFGTLPWRKIIILHHHKWQWNPLDIVGKLEDSIADPAVRENW
jgi:hypothetical protein